MILLLITFVINSALGIYIFAKSRNRRANQILAGIFLLLGWWAFSVFMLKNGLNPKAGVWWARAAFSGPFLLPTLFLWLSWFFPAVKKLTKTDPILFIFGIGFFLTFPFTLVKANNAVGYEFTFWSSRVFLVFFLVYMILGFINFFRGYRQSRDRITKKHFQFFITGMALAFLIGTTTNLILPAVFQFRDWNNFGPMGTIFFSSLTSYAVVRHRFLNPRLVVKKYIIVAVILLIEIGILILFLQNTAVLKGINMSATDSFWTLVSGVAILAVFGLYFINERLITIFLPEDGLDITSMLVSDMPQKAGKYSLEHFRNDAQKLLQKECDISSLECMVLQKGVILYASSEGIKKLQSSEGEIKMDNDVVIRKDSIWGYATILLIQLDKQKPLDGTERNKLQDIGAKIAETLAQLYSINSSLAKGQARSEFKHSGDVKI